MSGETNYLDDSWEHYVITKAERHGDYYDIGMREPHEEAGCMGFCLSVAECEAVGIVPLVGLPLSLCGAFGYPIRGVIVNSALIFHRTEAEQRAKNQREAEERQAERRREFEEKGRAELDAKYAALPPVFQARIDKFRRNNPDFRWEYEGYEMFCCEEAVKLARHLGTAGAVEKYGSLDWAEQSAIDRAAGISDDHSGNTHGAMATLAFWYLEHPENVEKMHGALAPLVGSFEYGCVPPDAT